MHKSTVHLKNDEDGKFMLYVLYHNEKVDVYENKIRREYIF